MQTAYAHENGFEVEIEDPFGYFKEALVCLNAGANRASVREVYNAVFCYIYDHLSNFTEVNGKEKYSSIFHRAKHARDTKSPFEAGLAEELGKEGFLTADQCKYLEELRDIRNDCSHPIGYDVPAAKAAFLLRQAVELFLGKPNFSPAMVRENIITRLGSSNYFGLDARARIVAEETNKVIPAAYHLLVKDLKAVWEGENEVSSRNARGFLLEAVSREIPALQKAIIVQFVQPLLDAADFKAAQMLVWMVWKNPRWVALLKATQAEQLCAILRAYLRDDKERARAVALILGKYAPELLNGALHPILELAIAPIVTEDCFLRLLGTPGDARDTLLDQYCRQARGVNRDEVVSFLDRNAVVVSETLSGQEAYRLLVVTSARRVLKRKPADGIGALLFDPARNWFLNNPHEGWHYARRKFLPDPEMFLFIPQDDVLAAQTKHAVQSRQL